MKLAESTASPRVALLTIGGDERAKHCYQTLLEEGILVGVVFSRRVKHVSRWKQLREYGLWYIAQQLIYQIEKKIRRCAISAKQLNEDDIDSIDWTREEDQEKIACWLVAKGVSVVVVSGFQFILKPPFLDQFDYCVNLHPSFLPEYRGQDPVVWGLVEQKRYFGITLHRVDEGVDTGNIFSQIRIRRPAIPYIGFVESRLAPNAGYLVREFLQNLRHCTLVEAEQKAGEYLPPPTLNNRLKRKQGLL